MLKEGIKPNNLTYSNLLKGIKNSKNPQTDLALKFLKSFNETHENKDIMIYNIVLDLFISLGQIQ